MRYLAFLTVFVAAVFLQAQSTGDYSILPRQQYGVTNYIKNPSAASNTLYTSTSSATISRVTTSGNKIDGVASFTCALTSGGYCEWALEPIMDGDDTGNCYASALFKGDGSNTEFRILDGSGTTLDYQNIGNKFGTTTWHTIDADYPCGSSRKIRVVQTSGTVTLGVAKVFYGHRPGVSKTGQVFAVTSTCPKGSTPANGSTLSRTVYLDYYAYQGVTHGQGNGSTTFNTPDYQGRFLRGVDGVAGRDPDASSRTAMNTGGNTGNAVGSVQGHAFQNHQHPTDAFEGADTNGWGRQFHNGFAFAANYGGQQTNNTGPASLLGYSTSSETRPTNANVIYCVWY